MSERSGAPRFTWVHGMLLVALIGALVAIGIMAAPHFTRERLEAFVRGAGAWGPAIVIGLQVAQILVAPVPGVFMPIVAGVLYGPLWGSLLALVGTTLGAGAAYMIGRRAGVPLLKRWLGEEKVRKAQSLVGGKRWLGLVPILLFPFSPSDAICFAAGMLEMRPAHFMLVVLLGRLPKDCALALAGAGLIRLGGWIS